MTTLHQLRRCPWAAAVRQALDNVGRDYGVVQVPYDRALRAQVRELTGQDLTPVLVDGDRIVSDSHRIVAYLYGTYGDSGQQRRAEELLRLVESSPAICAVGS